MHFEPDHLYHIYNQGNNRQKIFFKRENYLYFLRKVRKHFLPYCDILAYCLMPNHFHFMVKVKEVEVPQQLSGGATSSRTPTKKVTFQSSIGILLASYTRAINKQEGTSGSLFRKKTKAECLSCSEVTVPAFLKSIKNNVPHTYDPLKQYPPTCFNYIHQNPVRARLVENSENWEYSSALDFAGIRNGTLVNKNLAEKIMPEIFQVS